MDGLSITMLIVVAVVVNISPVCSIIRFKKEMKANNGDISKISKNLYPLYNFAKSIITAEITIGVILLLLYGLACMVMAGM